tara:strand:- start:118 stop:501 length:384 start_codon:yes stop_codon:yes gene_type:complete
VPQSCSRYVPNHIPLEGTEPDRSKKYTTKKIIKQMIITTPEAVEEELEAIQQLANKYEKSVLYGSSGEALQTTISAVFNHSPEIIYETPEGTEPDRSELHLTNYEDQPTIEVGLVHPEFGVSTTLKY